MRKVFQATGLIESFIGDANDNVDFLITDTTAPFYSRVGVIAMADTAQVSFVLAHHLLFDRHGCVISVFHRYRRPVFVEICGEV